MENNSFNRLTSKYAIIMIILYVIGYALGYLPNESLEPELRSVIVIGFHFFSNIIVALILSFDMKKLEIKKSIILWSAVFFDILGVTLFLLNVIHKQKTANA